MTIFSQSKWGTQATPLQRSQPQHQARKTFNPVSKNCWKTFQTSESTHEVSVNINFILHHEIYAYSRRQESFLYRHTEQHHTCHMYICASDHETECKNKFIFIWLQSITKSNMLQQKKKKKQERETRGEKTKTNNRKILCHIINPLNGISLYCAVFFFMLHWASPHISHSLLYACLLNACTCIQPDCLWYWFNQMLFKCYCLSS